MLPFAFTRADETDGLLGVFDCLARLACFEGSQGAVAEKDNS
jgi:hypothetical protein